MSTRSAETSLSYVRWSAHLATSYALLRTGPALGNMMTPIIRLVSRASLYPTPTPASSGASSFLPFEDIHVQGLFTFSCFRKSQSQFTNADHSPGPCLPGVHGLVPPLTGLAWDHSGAVGEPDILLLPCIFQASCRLRPFTGVFTAHSLPHLLLSLQFGPKWAFLREAFP